MGRDGLAVGENPLTCVRGSVGRGGLVPLAWTHGKDLFQTPYLKPRVAAP
jgi:hypothetical protein